MMVCVKFVINLFLILSICMFPLSLLADNDNSTVIWCDDVKYDPGHPLAFETIVDQTKYLNLMSIDKRRDADDLIINKFLTYIKDLDNSIILESYKTEINNYKNESDRGSAKWELFEIDDNLVFDIQGWGIKEDEIKINCTMFRTDKSLQAIVYTSNALYRSGQIGLRDAREMTAKIIKSVYNSYENRLYNGFSMWPWETYINGLRIDFEDTTPTMASKNQIVFMRPSLSPVVKFDGNQNSELDLGLIVEPVGIVRYLNDNYSSWFGVSPMIAITNSNGVGYGLLARYDTWQIAAGYHEKDDADDDVLLYVSMDLYDLIIDKDKRKAAKDNFLSDIREKLDYKENSP